MVWRELINKKIYVILDDESKYSGIVKEISYLGKSTEDTDLYLIGIIDKFNKFVCFKNTSIKKIKEEE